MMTRPATPPAQRKAVSPTEDFVATHQRPQDLYRAQQRLQMAEGVSRRTRLLLHKASKGLSKANTRAAGLEASVQRLESQLATLRPQGPRRRVHIDPNQRFADIENIRAAIGQSVAQPAQPAHRDDHTEEESAPKDAAIAAAEALKSMCFNWKA
ncbi:hypothetical protein BS50DRAFT_594992 [Corynespora cassiicola Philippines]|uniref:Uncharacterized protein n=1 Tax=Corynespora cassiicola Philippines TaxID=1448308 RepID=A0A2T2N0Q4_CORCC|nr:hypothetical protein BS50DRAFT_594992 [Corynespora cassiicola Philippines]